MTRGKAFTTMLCAVLAGCRDAQPPPRGVDDGTAKRFRLRGVVVRTNEKSKTATIQHEKISNDDGDVWMEAMTMEFPVVKDEDFRKLTKGAEVTGVVVSRQSDYEYWVEGVEVR
jgi:Cu/Ag efflux protein CusF